MKQLAAVATVITLAGCGGSSDSSNLELFDDQQQGTSVVFNPDGPVINACAAPYFQELEGRYDGRLSYDDPEDETLDCEWEAELAVTLRQDAQLTDGSSCYVAYALQADMTSGSDGCGGLTTNGDLLNQLSVITNGDYAAWNSPPWPIELLANTPTALDSALVYPIGETGNVSVWEYIFDGRGNITFAETTDPISGWNGVLVKKTR